MERKRDREKERWREREMERSRRNSGFQLGYIMVRIKTNLAKDI